jgi:uncharacterized membrane-anchored protein YitT (DUF2179 family)
MKKIRLQKFEVPNFLLEVKSYATILLGAFTLAIGYSLFIVPHKLVPGGVFGLSIVAFEVVNLSIGKIALLINIPLLFWGAKALGKTTVLKTAVFMVSSSFLIDAIAAQTGKTIIIDDILVSGIFGGLLVGTSIFIVKIGGATTGGSDIVARILSKNTNLTFSQLVLIMDAVVVVLGIITFKDYTMAAYCLITIVTTSKTIGHYVKQSEQEKTVLIFSKYNTQIQKAIKLDEFIKGDVLKLIQNDNDDKMVLVTKNAKRLKEVKTLIYKTDPLAHFLALESA